MTPETDEITRTMKAKGEWGVIKFALQRAQDERRLSFTSELQTLAAPGERPPTQVVTFKSTNPATMLEVSELLRDQFHATDY